MPFTDYFAEFLKLCMTIFQYDSFDTAADVRTGGIRDDFI